MVVLRRKNQSNLLESYMCDESSEGLPAPTSGVSHAAPDAVGALGHGMAVEGELVVLLPGGGGRTG